MREVVQLDLFSLRTLVPKRVPWDGARPRELTASYKRFILKTQGEKKRERFDLNDQYDLFVRTTGAAPPEGGRSFITTALGE